MGAGFTYRMGRIFGGGEGRAVIVPVDHGLLFGAITGLEDPCALLKRLIAAGIDGTLLSPGIARQTAHLFATRTAPARVLAVDLPLQSNVPGGAEDTLGYDLIGSVDDALALGFDAVKTMTVWGVDHGLQMKMLARIATIRQACNRWDIPLMIEPVLWGGALSEAQRGDPSTIAHACRVCVELGADILKAPYIAEDVALRELVARTPVPVVLLGGARRGSLSEVLETAERGMQAGVRAVVFGRNVWQHDDPVHVVRALRRVVHEGMSARDAARDTATIA